MPIERAADHPTFELGGNAITSLAAPARGSDETALFRIDLPAGGALPAHHHDHFDVFTVTAGSATMHIGEDEGPVVAGDAVVVPPETVPPSRSSAIPPTVAKSECPAWSSQ